MTFLPLKLPVPPTPSPLLVFNAKFQSFFDFVGHCLKDATTLSMMTFSIMTLGITIHSIMDSIPAINKNHTCCNDTHGNHQMS